MARLTVKATELSDVKVNYVSLVKRGANRIPFRITKSEGNTAVAGIDLGSFFLRKADADEAGRQAARKSDDLIKAAAEMLTKAGYTVSRKSEPADDGVGSDETTLEGEGADAGGQRNDGEGTDETRVEGEDADAGGPRNDGQTMPTAVQTTKTDDPATEEEALAKEEGDEGPDAKEPDGDEEVQKRARKSAGKTAKKTAKARKEDPEEDPETEEVEKQDDPEEDKEVEKSGKAQKADNAEVLTALREMFTKSEQSLAAAMTAQLTKIGERMTGIEGRLEKTEATVAKTDTRFAALVPGQSAPDATAPVRKTGSNVPPPLDTAYGWAE